MAIIHDEDERLLARTGCEQVRNTHIKGKGDDITVGS